MVSDLLLQGKPVRPVFIKTRSSSAVAKKKTNSTKPGRSTTTTTTATTNVVPVERKENVAFATTEPSCSYTTRQNIIPHARAVRTPKGLRPKMKRDGFKFKSEKPSSKSINHIMHNMQNTNCLVRQRLKAESSNKLGTIKEKTPKSKRGTSESDLDRVQLREICFVKDGEGKTVIAKYTTTSEDKTEECDDNLIVSWDSSNTQHATVFSQKHSVQPFLPSKSLVEPGCSGISGRQGAFRVHNFARSNSFTKNKRNKRSLRRLATSVEQTPKVEKLKKRKKTKGNKVG